MSQHYDVGTRVWHPDPTEGWVPAEVEEKIAEGDKVKLVLRLSEEEVDIHRGRVERRGG